MKMEEKRKVGRPPGRRPLLSIRVDPDLYDAIVAAAKLRRITIAAEACRRLDETFKGRDFDADFVRFIERGAGDALRKMVDAQRRNKAQGDVDA